jgi:hypothetical protein
MSKVFLDSELSASERDPTTAKFNVIPMPLEVSVMAAELRTDQALFWQLLMN